MPENPFFYYNTVTRERGFDRTYVPNKILYNAVDFLPTMLAHDASIYFSNRLIKWVPSLVESDSRQPFADQKLLPEIKRAVVTCNGNLTPGFEYISELRSKAQLSLSAGKTELDPCSSVLNQNITLKPKHGIIPEALDFNDDQ